MRIRCELALTPAPRADEPAPQSKTKPVKLKTNKGNWAYVEP